MKSNLKVVFAGTPDNAATTLEQLYLAGIQIVGVLTRMDSFVGRSKELRATPVADKATQLSLNVFKSNSMDDLTLDWLKALDADLGVVVAYGTIFRDKELGLPRLGWVNLHYSLLPEFPGPAPVQHALLQGKNVTGVTVFRLDRGIDTGPIVGSERIEIEQSDNSATLLSRLTGVGAKLLTDVIEAGDALILSAQPQHRIGDYAVASKPTRDLAKLDFTKDALSQLNKIRAMNPEPMAWFDYNGDSIRVIRASLGTSAFQEVSNARLVDKNLVVGCMEGSLVLEVLQPAGKKEMSGADWFRGLRTDQLMLS